MDIRRPPPPPKTKKILQQQQQQQVEELSTNYEIVKPKTKLMGSGGPQGRQAGRESCEALCAPPLQCPSLSCCLKEGKAGVCLIDAWPNIRRKRGKPFFFFFFFFADVVATCLEKMPEECVKPLFDIRHPVVYR